MTDENIPLVNLSWQHEQVSDEVDERFKEILSRTAFVLGDEVKEFEDRFAEFSGVSHAVGVASGTDAIELAIRALDIGPGDEVIVPTNTFVASALGVVRAGASPVLVDCDPDRYLIDVAATEDAITERTAAVMPVHLYGQMAPVESLAKVASKYDIALLEDAAQSQGATRNGDGPATHSALAATSFYPGKNLGAYGDAGAVLTDDAGLAGHLRALRNYGSETKYHHPIAGFNSRLDTLQAAVLLAKLEHLDEWNELRRQAAERYDEMLSDVSEITTPVVDPDNVHVWHLYVIRVPNRDDVYERVRADGVGVGIHYPVPIHLQGAFDGLGHGPGDFPVAEGVASEVLSLPLFPGITETQQERVVDALRSAIVHT